MSLDAPLSSKTEMAHVNKALDAYHTRLRAEIARQRQGYFTNLPKNMQGRVASPIIVKNVDGQDISESPLKLAVRYRRTDLVRDLLRCGADVHQQTGPDNLTPVHELNTQLDEDYKKNKINDIRLTLIANSMKAQANIMYFLPYLTVSAVVAPGLISLFMLSGQYHNLQYYAALVFATIKIIKDNAPVLGAGFRTLLYGLDTYLHFKTHNTNEESPPQIIKPSSLATRNSRQLYDTIRLSLYLCAYTALACGNIPLYGALFTSAIAACSIRQTVKLFQLLNNPKIRAHEIENEEDRAKFYNQEAKIEKILVKVFERAAYTLLVGSWFISPMNVATLATLSVLGLAVFAAKSLTVSLIESYHLSEFNKHVDELGTETLNRSTYFRIDHSAEYQSISDTISWCSSGMLRNISLFILAHVNQEGFKQTMIDVARLAGDTIDAYIIQVAKQISGKSASSSELGEEEKLASSLEEGAGGSSPRFV